MPPDSFARASRLPYRDARQGGRVAGMKDVPRIDAQKFDDVLAQAEKARWTGLAIYAANWKFIADVPD